ncbi:hypothetical protein [Alicyclobacillus acidiphilus]|uniref:hypothetical protein n=1 Tax=Alicyclobacillus acidiphilus TaxID=182455 RepID=UPI0008340943|nr:hypothetical protein [Alicyclobacillus acidiphilus]
MRTKKIILTCAFIVLSVTWGVNVIFQILTEVVHVIRAVWLIPVQDVMGFAESLGLLTVIWCAAFPARADYSKLTRTLGRVTFGLVVIQIVVSRVILMLTLHRIVA